MNEDEASLRAQLRQAKRERDEAFARCDVDLVLEKRAEIGRLTAEIRKAQMQAQEAIE